MDYQTYTDPHMNGGVYVPSYEPNAPHHSYPDSSTPVQHDTVPSHDHPDFGERGEIDGKSLIIVFHL